MTDPTEDTRIADLQAEYRLREATQDRIREALTAERDAAREDCGHQRAMKESIRSELSVFIRLKMAADDVIAALVAERDSLRGVVQAVGALLDRYDRFEDAVPSDRQHGRIARSEVRAALAAAADAPQTDHRLINARFHPDVEEEPLVMVDVDDEPATCEHGETAR